MSKGGRKVFRNKAHAKRQRIKQAGGIFAAVVGLSALVFVGYSVAKPIFNYINSEDAVSDSEVEPWTPPSESDAVTKPAVSDIYSDSAAAETSGTTVSDDKAASQASPNNTDDDSYFSAYELPTSALSSSSALSDYISQAKNDGYNSVVVTLKAEGGKIYYSTRSEFAAMDEDAIVGTMPAQQIASMIKGNGLKAIALVNLLEDNNRYGENRSGSYHNSDGTTWLDNAVAKGGKPWLSPFESETLEYVSFLADEITGAGFDAVIADGIVFPEFRSTDLNYIGDSVKSSTRYTALLDTVNIVKSAADANSAEFMMEINAADIVYGRAEAFKPEQLKNFTLLVEFSPSDFSENVIYNGSEVAVAEMNAADKCSYIFGVISQMADESTQIIPLIHNSNVNMTEFSDVINALISDGYDSYVVQ
jgi:hypothetical protein